MGRKGLVGTLIATAAVAVAAVPVALAAPSVTVQSATTAMTNTPSSQTPVSVGCPSGATLVGGGFRDYVALDGSGNMTIPTNGLTMHGTYPGDSGASPAGNSSANPAAWTAMGGFAAVSEAGDDVTAFGMCVTGGPAATEVVTKTVNGPQVAATTAAATVTCPSGTSLVGGGGLTNNGTTQPSYKVIGSYPSDAAGTPAANGSSNPGSWTAVGAAGGVGSVTNTTTVFAMCATDGPVQISVARTDFLDNPSSPTTFVTATATCASGTTLIGGGENADGNATGADGGTPQQGVHIRGTYPSTSGGAAVANGTTTADSWTTIVQSGGQVTPGTDTHVWALCLGTASAGGSGSTSSSGSGGSGPGSGGTGNGTTGGPPPGGPPGSAGGPSSGGSSASSGDAGNGAGAATGTVAATSPTAKTAIVKTGKAGSLTVGAGSQAATVAWPKSGLGSGSIKIAASYTSIAVPGSKGVSATSGAVTLSVTRAGGGKVARFTAPLDLAFPGAAANVTPAFSADGTSWKSVPRLVSAALPRGLSDGYYRDRSGGLHILTLHPAADFGLLIPGTGVKVTPEALALGYLAAPALPLGKGAKLKLSVASTVPGTLVVTLRRGSKTLATWHEKLGTARAFALVLPAAARTAGRYRILLKLSADGKSVSHSAPIRFVAPAT